MDATQGHPYYGIVTSYNPATHSAKVIAQPQDPDVSPLISGWLPIVTSTLGNGWGLVAPPNIGEQVVVVPDSGDPNHGIIIGSHYSGPSQPPQPGGTAYTQVGEMALVHQSGSYIMLHNDGSIDVFANQDMRLHSKRNIDLTADGGTISMHATTVTVDGTLTAGFGGPDQVSLQGHRHGTGGNVAAATVAPTPGT